RRRADRAHEAEDAGRGLRGCRRRDPPGRVQRMTRLDIRLDALRSAGRKALVPFVTAGDPSLEATVPVMHALVEAGADAIELGVPFSDPMADGPVIQRSSERALARGAGIRYVLECVRGFRTRDAATPV